MPRFTERVHSCAHSLRLGRIYVIERQFQHDLRRCFSVYGDAVGGMGKMPCQVWNERADGGFDVDSFDTTGDGYCGCRTYGSARSAVVDVIRLTQIVMAGIMTQRHFGS